MSYKIGLLIVCLARLSVGEPPIPYPPAGPPSGSSFSQSAGGSGQFQGLPDIISARSEGLEQQANHRIHFNLFKDHETRKSKDNISFKLGGDDQYRGGANENFGRNSFGQARQAQRFSDISQKYGTPQTNALSRNFGSPSSNHQNDFSRSFDIASRYGTSQNRNYESPSFNKENDLFRQGNSISSRYGTPNDNSGLTSKHGASGFDQRYSQNDHQTRNTGFTTQATSQPFQPQPQYGPPQRFNSNYSPSHSQTESSDYQTNAQFRTNQQPSSNYGTPGLQRRSQVSPTYGVPHQGQEKTLFRRMNHQQQGSQFNSLDKYNPQQGGNTNYNGDEGSPELSEKVNYEFEYEVRGDQSHGHEESREGDEAWGSYKVQLPDGRTMLVEYTADDRGYRPKITYSDLESQQQPY